MSCSFEDTSIQMDLDVDGLISKTGSFGYTQISVTVSFFRVIQIFSDCLHM